MDTQLKFKRYEMEQLQLLPPSLDELITGKHLVRVVNEIIEKMQLEAIESGCKG